MHRLTGILVVLSLAGGYPAGARTTVDTAVYQQWIAEMKAAPRGPFSRIRWFCEDGAVLPPKDSCRPHGGGHQHGELGSHARILRQQGYWIANLLAGLDAGDARALVGKGDFPDRYNQLLIEKFLVNADNGWILRQALFYRGAIQEEDERAGGHQLLTAMAGEPEWVGLRYPALRIGARMLPHGEDTASAHKVRQMAVSIADQDAGFQKLRVKIHGSPDAGDAKLVREYATNRGRPALSGQYGQLADEIDKVYHAPPLPQLLEASAKVFSGGPWLQQLLRGAAADYGRDDDPANRYRATAKLLADLRDGLPKVRSPSARLRVLDVSLAVEAENFRASAELREQMPRLSRAQRAGILESAAEAAYGAGLINRRSLGELKKSLARLERDKAPLEVYLRELNYLGRAPGWGTQSLRFQFYRSMEKLAGIEPLAMHFIQDQLRGSPLLFYSQTLDTLTRDANRQSGVKHKLFGKEIGVGFHALNPGLARGTLHTRPNLARLDDFDSRGIYLLPETISDLPPVAGIITVGEGNPLSHVQLLARNLGIPNVTIDQSLASNLQQHDGQKVVLAVSPAGLVELDLDGARWQKIFGEWKSSENVVIRPDLGKLDLGVREFINLDDLRADDSGRTVGPKAAKLGELRHHFPGKVAPGMAIPFGVFRETVLDKPYRNSGKTVFEWMVGQYTALHALPQGSAERKTQTEKFRGELYDIILNARLGDEFRRHLREAMAKAFGKADGYGVFVRSDTNVEDLAGFTGAGLNLTLPNVIGFDNVVKGLNEVWASPFTARAFAWRQSHMEQPQHVYPAVLLLQSVANDKSGVMVTQDIDTGDRSILSVAVNEGVGGAVDGQSAESLRIDTRDGSVRLLATATASLRRLPSSRGGVDKIPVTGSESVLKPDEIPQLIAFARELPDKFPPITDDRGNPAPADVEFGFKDGKLHLFQLRPFLESREARGSGYLAQMDQALQDHMNRQVSMNEVPK
ncbi:MAG: PEP/pyruvate-binding domain-containing protein [Pseudomonadota bacterium]|nr:PEP/pyruvate-binding domain-containing protein [Pseudomonadota bacterium]